MKPLPERKLMRGPRVDHFHTFLQLLDMGKWFYLWEKAYHPAWVGNMSLNVLRYKVKRGHVYMAVNNPKFKEKKNGHTPLEVAAG